MLRILSTKKKRKFYRDQEGSHRLVLLEAEEHGDQMFGFTENYVKVSMPYDASMINTIQNVVLEGLNSDGVMVATRLAEPVTA